MGATTDDDEDRDDTEETVSEIVGEVGGPPTGTRFLAGEGAGVEPISRTERFAAWSKSDGGVSSRNSGRTLESSSLTSSLKWGAVEMSRFTRA